MVLLKADFPYFLKKPHLISMVFQTDIFQNIIKMTQCCIPFFFANYICCLAKSLIFMYCLFLPRIGNCWHFTCDEQTCHYRIGSFSGHSWIFWIHSINLANNNTFKILCYNMQCSFDCSPYNGKVFCCMSTYICQEIFHETSTMSQNKNIGQTDILIWFLIQYSTMYWICLDQWREWNWIRSISVEKPNIQNCLQNMDVSLHNIYFAINVFGNLQCPDFQKGNLHSSFESYTYLFILLYIHII